jgi:Tol biopolymer transport system component
MRWVAYTSDESGAPEVYVRKLSGGASQRVSARGGAQPRWRADGRELFYLAPDGTLMAAAVHSSNESIEVGAPSALFKTRVTTGHLNRRNQYLVSRNGQRVLVNLSEEDENAAPITVIVNWDVASQPR